MTRKKLKVAFFEADTNILILISSGNDKIDEDCYPGSAVGQALSAADANDTGKTSSINYAQAIPSIQIQLHTRR